MLFTVAKLAALAGVSVRTLHFYDEFGLLKPARRGYNGYRFYNEAQLLRLQQILFFRKLGFDLRQIAQVLGQADFDQISTLANHRKTLLKQLEETRRLVKTIDKTINHLKGIRKMKATDMFDGFDPEVQAKHEQYLIERLGEGAREHISESRTRVSRWSKAEWEKSAQTFARICEDASLQLKQGLSEDSSEVQLVIRRHFDWLKQFWIPTRESYAGYGTMIEDSALRTAFEAHHPRLPEFMGNAIRLFAKANLV